jgi:hypothetical protein
MSPEALRPPTESVYDAVNQKFAESIQQRADVTIQEYMGGQMIDLVQGDTSLPIRLIRSHLTDTARPDADTWQAQLSVDVRFRKGTDLSKSTERTRMYIATYTGLAYEVIMLEGEPHLRELGFGEISDLVATVTESRPGNSEPPAPLRAV